MRPVLHGYKFSVYARVVRLALREKGVVYDWAEVDPFSQPPDAGLRRINPFGRVPVLLHDGLALHETAAICRYVDAAFAGPPLQPAGAAAIGQMAQVIAIVDSYGYWPMVRQVYAHRVFRPASGAPVDEAQIGAGLVAAAPVLAALNAIAAAGRVLAGPVITLADLHLAPMVAAFEAAPEGAALLHGHAHLVGWWQSIRRRDSMVATQIGLPGGAALP